MQSKVKRIVIVSAVALAVVGLIVGMIFMFGGKKKNTDPNALTLFINDGNKFDGATKDSVWKRIEEQTGTSLVFKGSNHGSNYYTQLNPLMNTIDDMPDVVFVVPTSAEMGTTTFSVQWTAPDKGLLYSYDELLGRFPAGTYPYIEKILYSKQYGFIMHNDAHFLLPNVTTRNSWGIYYRTDWLINVGYYLKDEGGAPILDAAGNKQPRYPETMDEFDEVLRLFTENDPDGNGQKDTYAFSPGKGEHCWSPLYHAFGVTPDWDLYGDEIDHMYLNDRFRDFLIWANDVYKKGYIYPTFSSLQSGGERDLFYEGKIGIMMTNAESHVSYIIDKMRSLGKDKYVGFGPAPEGTETLGQPGSKGFSDWGGWWGGFAITKKCKNVEGALKLFDYLLSPEGSALRTYGIEGVHYNVVDGEIVPDLEARAAEGGGKFEEFVSNGVVVPSGRYVMGLGFGYPVDWDAVEATGEFKPQLTAEDIDPQNADLVQAAFDRVTLKTSRLVNVTAYSPTVLTLMAAAEDTGKTFVNNAIIGKKNLGQDWDKMIADVKNAKWQQMIQAMKATAETLGVL